MTSIVPSLFPHRVNRDGSFDSICKRCFLTIASCASETELAAAEREHMCDGPPLLHSFSLAGVGSLVPAHM
ncbi:MAG TPA: hypothetical protein VGN01_07325 [Acidobacteriaceae bacterium]|jgi:hypothetical protein